MADSDIQAGRCLVGRRIVHQHSLQAIVESDQPVLAVILLGLLDRFVVHPMKWNVGRDLAAPVLSVLGYANIDAGGCRGHGGMFRYNDRYDDGER